MKIDQLVNEIAEAVAEAVREPILKALNQGVELDAGERCPCCGAKKRKPEVSERMLEANRRNILKAIAARRK